MKNLDYNGNERCGGYEKGVTHIPCTACPDHSGYTGRQVDLFGDGVMRDEPCRTCGGYGDVPNPEWPLIQARRRIAQLERRVNDLSSRSLVDMI